MRTIIAILLAGCCGAAAAEEVYKWTDQNGRVHYGDRPKAGAQVVDVKPGSGTGEPSDEEAAKTAAAKAAECDSKKKQLAGYRSAPSIKEINGLGEEREYSAEEKQKLIARVEQQVTAACGPAPESES